MVNGRALTGERPVPGTSKATVTRLPSSIPRSGCHMPVLPPSPMSSSSGGEVPRVPLTETYTSCLPSRTTSSMAVITPSLSHGRARPRPPQSG